MSKPTSGPWSVEERTMDGGVVGYNVDPVAKADEYPYCCIDSLADARLIAAAPDLLEACRAIVDAWERGTDGQALTSRLVRMRAAIAKAEGRS